MAIINKLDVLRLTMARTENNNINSELEKSISSALDLLKNGDFAQAQSVFSYVMRLRYTSEVAEFGIVTCKYWLARYEQARRIREGVDLGSFLFEQWQKFEEFYKTRKRVSMNVVDAVMCCVYSQALEQFNKDLSVKKNSNVKLIYMCAMAYKKIGDYNNALLNFGQCLKIDDADSNVMAQLADTFMLIDKEQQAKILFREAFSIDPEKIQLDQIECDMIKNLMSTVMKNESSGDETLIKYWMIVYGWLGGELDSYRELTSGEASKIKNDIRIIERDIDLSRNYDGILVAKLLNKYFWLYDYYNLQNPNPNRLVEIENKMKKYSYNIYIIFKQSNQETI